MSLKGYDYFTPDAGTITGMNCKVCGVMCDVERGVEGPRSFAAAMGGIKTLHDRFSCPYSEIDWHEKALNLFQDIEKCNSPSIKKIMEADLDNMIREKNVL